MMDFHLVTAVWGAWHLDCMNRAMLPTLLAAGNLPALAASHGVQYKIFTTERSAGVLRQLPVFARLRALVPVELRVVADQDNITSYKHLEAWQTACDEAAQAAAVVVSVHPDVVWSDGTFANLAKAFENGKKAVVLPNIRVTSESFLPALREGLENGKGMPIALPGRAMMRLAASHLHPLSMLAVPGNRSSVPTTEALWPVPGRGFLMRQASRPAIAADTARCEIDVEFYLRDITDPEEVHCMTDSDEMLMLSLAPLAKDFGAYELEFPITPLSLARWCRHPQNRTPLNLHYASQHIKLHYAPGSDADWQDVVEPSDAFIDEMKGHYRAIGIMEALREEGCGTAARILALALHETELARRWSCDGSLVVFAPSDRALATRSGKAVKSLLAPGEEAGLLELLSRHVAIAPPESDGSQPLRSLAGATLTLETRQSRQFVNEDIPVLKTVPVEETATLYLIDGILS